MEFIQNYNPLNNVWLSALVACLPIALFFLSLVVFKLKGYVAGFLTTLLATLIALFVYKMPFDKVFASLTYGFLYGLWPIAWIIIAAIFLYKLSVKSGYFAILRDSIVTITPDQRIQVILIGFCFGAFLEGAIGFGGPVAITAALLVGLGLQPLYAAGLCMIANTAPVAFGAVGIPVIAMAKIVNVPDIDISAMTGLMLLPLSALVPFFLIFLMNGLKGIKETWPVLLIAGLTFSIVQYFSATYLGPELPSIASAAASIAATTIFLKFWQPKNIFRFDSENNNNNNKNEERKVYSASQIILAWLPFIILILMIVVWTTSGFKALFTQNGIFASSTLQFNFETLANIFQTQPVVPESKAVKSLFELPLINTVGTSIFVTALISAFFLKVKPSDVASTFMETIHEMKFAILTIGLVLSFAYIANYSGISATLALALAHTGKAFAFFSPLVGWVGVFLTGSDTSSNLLFATLQQVTARALDIPETLFLAANTVGGVVGKMISPQSIAVACAAVGLVGRESELFRFAAKYSIALIILIGLMTAFIAFVVPEVIPNTVNG